MAVRSGSPSGTRCAAWAAAKPTSSSVPTRRHDDQLEAEGIHYPGTYLAGGHDRLRTSIECQAVENEELVNMPAWLSFTFRIDGGTWVPPVPLVATPCAPSRFGGQPYSPTPTHIRAVSSAGRAAALQAVGHRFDPCTAHYPDLGCSLR